MTRPSFHQPAEWDRHSACWLAWPSHGHLWQENLAAARAALAPVLAKVRFHRIPVGDIWLRDTAPIFVKEGTGALFAACFRFNGWGEKYVLPEDDRVATRVGAASGQSMTWHDFVLEGGSVEVDGEGTVLTTRQCLLNPNRNPGLSQTEIEAALRTSLGAEKVLWLDEGLLNDHTDGHIDTLARFTAPGVVVCMEARDPADPNAAILDRLAADLAVMTDARGRRLQVVRIPSPGLLENEDGEPMPASFVNFYIGNETVVVPTYGTAFDAEAVSNYARSRADEQRSMAILERNFRVVRRDDLVQGGERAIVQFQPRRERGPGGGPRARGRGPGGPGDPALGAVRGPVLLPRGKG